MLRAGGTVVDAATAAAAAVCVVHASSCGLGGGGFALLHRADGRDFALDYREVAPAGATPERFRARGKLEPALLRTGGLAVGVPGEVAGLVALHRRFGRLPLARVLAPAIRLARDGFTVAEAPHLAREIEHSKDLLAADPDLRRVFLAGGTSAPGRFPHPAGRSRAHPGGGRRARRARLLPGAARSGHRRRRADARRGAGRGRPRPLPAALAPAARGRVPRPPDRH